MTLLRRGLKVEDESSKIQGHEAWKLLPYKEVNLSRSKYLDIKTLLGQGNHTQL